jgi:hypothetical protein
MEKTKQGHLVSQLVTEFHAKKRMFPLGSYQLLEYTWQTSGGIK